VDVLGTLPQPASGVPPSVSGANMTSAVALVSLAEALAVPPLVPVVGVSLGLPVSLGVADGVAVAVSLGVADGVTVTLGVGDGELVGVGVGVQATAGSAVSGAFFFDVPAALVFTPMGTCRRCLLAAW
jgi:hypothetical protein